MKNEKETKMKLHMQVTTIIGWRIDYQLTIKYLYKIW